MSTALSVLALIAVGSSNLQPMLDDIRNEQDVPGISVVIAHNGETLFAAGSGFADLENHVPMTANTQLYAGSISKIFTAILTLQLVESGILELDQKVPDLSVDSPLLHDGVKIAHLLTHASGLQREGDFGYWFTGEFPDSFALTKYLRTAPLRDPPGTSIHYSNLGYAKLGEVIAAASHSTYFEVLQSKLLDPLGLSDSGAPGPAGEIGAGYTPPNRIIPSAEKPFAGVGKRIGNRHLRQYHDASAMTPAFGIYTSARDLSRLAQFLLGDDNENILSRAMRARMLRRQPSGWGLGIKLGRLDGREIAQHSGWFAAHRSHLMLDIESGVSVVVIANSDNAAPNKIAEAFMRKTLKELLESDVQSMP